MGRGARPAPPSCGSFRPRARRGEEDGGGGEGEEGGGRRGGSNEKDEIARGKHERQARESPGAKFSQRSKTDVQSDARVEHVKDGVNRGRVAFAPCKPWI